MKLTDAVIQKSLTVLMLICVAIALIGSVLFTVFADFLAQFPTDGF